MSKDTSDKKPVKAKAKPKKKSKVKIPEAFDENGKKLIGFANPAHKAAFLNTGGRPKLPEHEKVKYIRKHTPKPPTQQELLDDFKKGSSLGLKRILRIISDRDSKDADVISAFGKVTSVTMSLMRDADSDKGKSKPEGHTVVVEDKSNGTTGTVLTLKYDKDED